MDLNTFNALATDRAADAMQHCCSAARWVSRMVAGRPYRDTDAILVTAEKNWQAMSEPDWLEAFDGHPMIGDPESLREKYRATLATASGEQSAVRDADDATIAALATGNRAYLERFGFIFIVFASGRSAREMLERLQERLPNDRAAELAIAAGEQWKITRLRLEKLFDPGAGSVH